MTSIRKSGITALTAAIALSLGAIPVAVTAGMFPGGDSTTLTPATDYFPGPTLTLATTPDAGRVTLSGSTLNQTFTGGQYCQVSDTAGSDSLLDLTGSISSVQQGVAGFRDGSIGVFEVTNASQCFRVDANSFTDYETLQLKLGTALSSYMAESAVFDIQMKTNDAKIVVRTTNSQVIDLTTQKPVVVGSDVVLLTGKQAPKGSPVIRSGDHVRLAVPKRGAWDTVTLTALVGSFSLEGGGDGGTTLPTTFTLLEPAEEPDFCPGDDYDEGTVDVDYALVKYVGETGGGGDCFGISLSTGPTSLRFLKPLNVSPDAQFLFTKTWTKTGSFAPSVTLDGVKIDFEFFANAQFNDLPYCPIYLYDGAALTGFTATNPASAADLADLASRDMVQDDPSTTAVEGAGTQFACIGSPRPAEVTATEVQVNDTIYLVGDANLRYG